MKGTAVVALALGGTLLACATGLDSDDPPDDRGLLVATMEADAIEWATDGTELYIRNTDGTEVVAVPAVGGATRTVHAGGLLSVQAIRAAAGKLYVVSCMSGVQASCQLLRIDPATGSSQPLLTHQTSFPQLTISSDARFVVFGDTLYDFVASTRRRVAGSVWSFSPAGSHLLQTVALTSTTEMRRVATGDLSFVSLADAFEFVQRFSSDGPVHFWSGSTPRFVRLDVVQSELRISVLDGLTRDSVEVLSVPNASGWPRLLTIGHATDDGRPLALWLGPYDWSQLHVIDVAQRVSKIAATISGRYARYPTTVRLSPDASHAAYVMPGRSAGTTNVSNVYVISLPP